MASVVFEQHLGGEKENGKTNLGEGREKGEKIDASHSGA